MGGEEKATWLQNKQLQIKGFLISIFDGQQSGCKIDVKTGENSEAGGRKVGDTLKDGGGERVTCRVMVVIVRWSDKKF